MAAHAVCARALATDDYDVLIRFVRENIVGHKMQDTSPKKLCHIVCKLHRKLDGFLILNRIYEIHTLTRLRTMPPSQKVPSSSSRARLPPLSPHT